MAWPELSDGDEATVADAIGDLPRLDAGQQDDPIPYQPRTAPPSWARNGGEEPLYRLYDHVSREVREDDLEAFRLLEPGGTYLDIPEELPALRR